MSGGAPPIQLLAALLAATPLVAASASGPATYAVGTIPVAPGGISVEFPIRGTWRGEAGGILLGQGTYDDPNPFAYLSALSPYALVHLDVSPSLRLSAGFQEILYREVAPLGLRDEHEERAVARARLQQPRGTAAVYEMVRLDLRSFHDAGGTHRLVLRPRLRVGQGVTLDARRVHTLVLFQEVALRFADASYTTRAFEFFRAFAGYTWTTTRGAFVTLGLVGQISLNPPATRYDLLWGPALGVAWRLRSAARAEAPPSPPEIETP